MPALRRAPYRAGAAAPAAAGGRYRGQDVFAAQRRNHPPARPLVRLSPGSGRAKYSDAAVLSSFLFVEVSRAKARFLARFFGRASKTRRADTIRMNEFLAMRR